MKRGWLHKVTGRPVLVHTKDDQTYEGVITEVHDDGIVLLAAQLHGANGSVPMAGGVFVPRANIGLVQIP